MPGEFKRVKQVFLEAVDKSDRTERDAWLRCECREDESLRGQVEALLRRHDKVGNFLEPPDIKSSGTPDPEAETFPRSHSGTPNDAVGSYIGPYQLLEQLGEGGMGTVYLAPSREPDGCIRNSWRRQAVGRTIALRRDLAPRPTSCRRTLCSGCKTSLRCPKNRRSFEPLALAQTTWKSTNASGTCRELCIECPTG